MAFILALIIGVIALLLLKQFAILGPIVAGFLAGFVTKGPFVGALAGVSVVLIGVFIFFSSSLAAFTFSGNITGLAFYQDVEPISLIKSVVGIGRVAIAAAAGLVGGLLRK